MSFISGLRKFGIEALKIGQYVLFGAQTAQTFQQVVSPGSVTGKDLLSRFIEIVKGVEMTGQAVSVGLTNPLLSGPQKLQAATVAVAQELASLHSGKVDAAVKNVALFEKAARGYAQATVDYLQAFDESAVKVEKSEGGETKTITVVPGV